MTAEAIDVVVALGWALVVWVIVLAAALAVVVLAGCAVVAWIVRGVWRLLADRTAAGPRRGLDGSLTPDLRSGDPRRHGSGRTALRASTVEGSRMTPTVILLAGARDLTEPGIVTGTLADIALNIADGPLVIRHGACPGERSADQAASDWISEIGHRYSVSEDPMPADWDHCAPNCPTTPGHRRRKKPGDTAHPGLLDDYCPGAGPRRNTAMVRKLPRPEWMVAFPEPGKPNYGTNGCIRLAGKAGIPVRRWTA